VDEREELEEEELEEEEEELVELVELVVGGRVAGVVCWRVKPEGTWTEVV
jgi:hypothetical protein